MPLNKDVIRVGLLGLGTVGSSTLTVLTQNQSNIMRRVGTPVKVTKILVRDSSKKRTVPTDDTLLTTDANLILNDPDVDIVVELIGGLHPAKEYMIKALLNGKPVVTANKEVMADSGKDIFEAAEAGRVDVFFEGSVGGGIPIIRPLKRCLIANKIQKVMGIVNGTTNYILTRMSEEGLDFAEVLTEAQRLGYAEADPTADVEGIDSARKMAILASIAFNSRVTIKDVYVQGISKISKEDIEYGRELGWTLKLVGMADLENGEIEIHVAPLFLPREDPLASVRDVFNAIRITGDAVGEVMFHGQGAGGMATASAVVADIIEAAEEIANGSRGPGCTCYEHLPIKSMGLVQSKYYLRIEVEDKPGVLAQIAGLMASHNISLHSVIQKKTTGHVAEIVFVTHKGYQKDIAQAVEKMSSLAAVKAVKNLIRVED